MTVEEDFRRLARGLRAMKFDFTVAGDYARKDPPEAVIADDVPLDEATLLTSRHNFGQGRCGGKGIHRIVLDIDYDAALIPSSTLGHHHLILDVALPWDKYETLLKALAEAKVIQRGYADASITKGYTAIRPPWEKKHADKRTA
jgi:hypothetical protein